MLSQHHSIGIEGISFATTPYYLNLNDLAKARGIDPDKFRLGLGQTQMAIWSPHEDPITLAHSSCSQVLKHFDISPDDIGLFIVGTETSVDHAKPIASFLQKSLQISKQARVYDLQHACYGLSAALNIAKEWFMSGRSKNKKALLVGTDLSYYGLKTAGEPTQGAGSVAIVISDNPKILTFDLSEDSTYSNSVMDFWRPVGQKTANVDGQYSIECYLTALKECLVSFQKNSPENFALLNHSMDQLIFHVPYTKMAQKAHKLLMEFTHATQPQINLNSSLLEHIQQDYEKRTKPSLDFNSRVGNTYTSSMYLSLINYLEKNEFTDSQKQIGLFSYGSGCMSEFFTAKILKGANEYFRDDNSVEAQLGRRKNISFETYEAWLKFYHKQGEPGEAIAFAPEPLHFGNSRLIYNGLQNGQRSYELSQ